MMVMELGEVGSDDNSERTFSFLPFCAFFETSVVSEDDVVWVEEKEKGLSIVGRKKTKKNTSIIQPNQQRLQRFGANDDKTIKKNLLAMMLDWKRAVLVVLSADFAPPCRRSEAESCCCRPNDKANNNFI